MRLLLVLTITALAMVVPSTSFAGDVTMIEDFESRPETRWRFFTDGVMGGISTGQAVFVREDGQTHAKMTGQVSTKNNGGFIQIRMEPAEMVPTGTSGVRLVVRGNDQRYFVHLRTRGTRLPWQYYQAGFDAGADWTEVFLPFQDFEPSGSMIRRIPRAESLISIGVVAYGRDHDADIDVREVGFY